MRTKRSNEVTPPFCEKVFAQVSGGIDLKIAERARRVLLLHRAAHEPGAVEFALARSPGGHAPYPAPDPDEMERVSLIIDAYYDALYKNTN